jgi:PAS domain-containing protein
MSSLHQELTLPLPDLLDRLGDAPGPLSVVNTRSGRVSACNEAFAALLDLDVTTATGLRFPSLVAPEDRDGIESVFAGLASGLLDSCQGRVRLTMHDGDVVDVLLRVEPLDADRPRSQVVLAISPAGASDAGPGLLRGDEDASRLALCVVRDDGRISELSEDVKDVLGWDGTHRGTSLHEAVHPDDAPLLMLAMGASAVDRRTATVGLRLRGGAGGWTAVRCAVSPLSDHKPPHYAVAIRASRPVAELPTERANRLESHLWRIAVEVQAAGVGGRAGDGEVWWNDPALGALSARQSEVLRRTVRGDRVPTIP